MLGKKPRLGADSAGLWDALRLKLSVYFRRVWAGLGPGSRDQSWWWCWRFGGLRRRSRFDPNLLGFRPLLHDVRLRLLWLSLVMFASLFFRMKITLPRQRRAPCGGLLHGRTSKLGLRFSGPGL